MNTGYMLSGTSPYGVGNGGGGSDAYGLGADMSIGASSTKTAAERVVGIDFQRNSEGGTIVLAQPTTLLAGVLGAAIAVIAQPKAEPRGLIGNVFAAVIGFVVGGGIATGFRYAEEKKW